ncbi:MAG: tyrosine--tRNA ligase [Patescibacteria group bacterium]|jgi:tyrosyl-tRNA synthetase
MNHEQEQELIEKLLTRGVHAIYPTEEMLRKQLESGKRLRFYLGIDPTSPHLHIGHAIGLRKLRLFQELGHEVILLLGSFTAMIGDPTDKLAARTQLTQKQVLENAATYKKQASKILRFTGKNPAKIMFNHKWLARLDFAEVIDLASHFTVQQMLERDMFEKRITDEKPIYLHEFFYPLMQGYDSVAMDVDGEIGGSDQMFNMLAGRDLLKEMKGKEKVVLTMKLLTNAEGEKMSKSAGGFIALDEEPQEMYGKIMSMDDSMIIPYFELATDRSLEEIEGMKVQMTQGVNPRDVKMQLAGEIVTIFHGKEAAEGAEEAFKNLFQQHEQPDVIEEFSLTLPMNIIDALVETRLATSRSEAKRLLSQQAIKMDGTVVGDETMTIETYGVVLQRGKRQFAKLK